jgi:hypothetical protein
LIVSGRRQAQILEHKQEAEASAAGEESGTSGTGPDIMDTLVHLDMEVCGKSLVADSVLDTTVEQ